MSRFVRTVDGGWVNLDHVAQILPQHGGTYFVTVTNEDGSTDEVEVQTEYLNSVLQHEGFVPATQGWHVVYHAPNGTSLRTEPILAWRAPDMDPVTLNVVYSLSEPLLWRNRKIVSPEGDVYTHDCTRWNNWGEFESHCRMKEAAASLDEAADDDGEEVPF